MRAQLAEKLPALAHEQDLASYRVAQENLTNVPRHANARHVALSLVQTAAGDVELCVRDDGGGIAAHETNGAGAGLAGMRERALLIGGVLRIRPHEEGGRGATRQAAAGDSAALSRLVEEVQHPVTGWRCASSATPEDAKDASQEILVRLITHLGSFEGRSQFMTWAYRIAVRQLTRTRKRTVESSVQGAEAFAAFLDRGLAERDFTAEEVEYRMLCAEVRISCTYGMLLCLSRPLRVSFILGDAMGMPDTVAAQICDISRAAQRQRLARARRTPGLGAARSATSARPLSRRR